MYRKTAGLLVAVVLAAGCGESREPSSPTGNAQTPGQGLWEGKVDALVADGRVVVKNGTERVIGYLVVEKNMAIVAMFPPCTDNCTTLVQGGEASIRYEDVPGYSPEAREAVVYWWRYGIDGRPEGAMSSELIRF